MPATETVYEFAARTAGPPRITGYHVAQGERDGDNLIWEVRDNLGGLHWVAYSNFECVLKMIKLNAQVGRS